MEHYFNAENIDENMYNSRVWDQPVEYRVAASGLGLEIKKDYKYIWKSGRIEPP